MNKHLFNLNFIFMQNYYFLPTYGMSVQEFIGDSTVKEVLEQLKFQESKLLSYCTEDDSEELEAIQTTQQILINFLKTMELFDCDEVILGTFLDNILLP
jgi:hypothetical protein